MSNILSNCPLLSSCAVQGHIFKRFNLFPPCLFSFFVTLKTGLLRVLLHSAGTDAYRVYSCWLVFYHEGEHAQLKCHIRPSFSQTKLLDHNKYAYPHISTYSGLHLSLCWPCTWIYSLQENKNAFYLYFNGLLETKWRKRSLLVPRRGLIDQLSGEPTAVWTIKLKKCLLYLSAVVYNRSLLPPFVFRMKNIRLSSKTKKKDLCWCSRKQFELVWALWRLFLLDGGQFGEPVWNVVSVYCFQLTGVTLIMDPHLLWPLFQGLPAVHSKILYTLAVTRSCFLPSCHLEAVCLLWPLVSTEHFHSNNIFFFSLFSVNLRDGCAEKSVFPSFKTCPNYGLNEK